LWFTWQNLMRRYPFPFRAIESYSLRHTDHAIAGSEGAATVWREKGYSGPLAVIPQFGVDPRIFAPAPAARRPVDRREYAARGRCRAQAREQQDTDGGFAIGYLGRLVPEKGVDLLVEAVGDMGDGWRLAILGGGPEQPRLETLVDRLGVGDRVTFAGWLPSLELGSFYRGLDVLVLPSRSRPNWVEQFGRVLIEAMACGVPVIGSDCGEIPHVIGDAGLVFPEGDARALRNCLVQLMATPALRADLARRGRERVLARFTQSQVAARTVAVYRELLA
jgi:glycosyltransferase involved in cell wall biosynthesis